MADLPLLDWHPEHKARRDDPETSHAAGRQAKGLAGEHHRRILYALIMWDGTAEQVACSCGLDLPQVQRRMSELLTAGLIELTGETRINSNNRRMRVFRRVGGG